MQTGLIEGMSNEAYHASEGVSKSGLDLIDRSPAHYAFRVQRQPTRAMEIGTAIHTAILEPERFEAEYMLLLDTKDRRASEYKQAVAVHGSERVLVASEVDNVAGMQESVMSQPGPRALVTASGRRELSAFATDPETGVIVRARFDMLTDDGIIVDLKKTQDARAEEFSRSVARYRYHVQAAFYSDVYEWVTGERPQAFKFVAIEEQSPHTAVAYQLDDDAMAHGRREYRRNLNTYAECLSSNTWPNYVPDSEILSLPNWMMAEIENDMDENMSFGD